MGMLARPQPEPGRVLLLTDAAERVSVFAGVLAGFGRHVELQYHSSLDDTGDLPGLPAKYGALVVDGLAAPLGKRHRDALEGFVRAGGRLVVIPGFSAGSQDPDLGALTGARVLEEQAAAEWFLKTCFGGQDLTARFPEEFAVFDSVVELVPEPDAQPLLSVSVGYRDRVVATERRTGNGRTTVVGLGGRGGNGFDAEIARLIRRALVPPSPAGAPDHIGLGIIGYGPYGGMGLYHGLAAGATEGVELVSACDSDPGRLKAAEERFAGLRTVTTAEELADDDATQVVVVATPPSSHHQLALQMMRAGKHVALEKPMCLRLAEADELLRASEEAGVSLTVHQNRRFDADFVAVSHAVSSGALGEVFNVETFVGGFEHPCRAWHSEVEISGGAVYDWGSHHLDWILQLMDGFPASLSAHGHKRVWHDVTNLDQVRVRLAWEDGREAEFLQSDVAGVRRPKFLVQGTRGTLAGWYRPVLLERIEPALGYVGEQAHHAEAPVELTLARYEPPFGLTETRIPPAAVTPFPFHRNLADHLLLGEPLAVSAESARRVVALLEAAQHSTDSGNVAVALPRL